MAFDLGALVARMVVEGRSDFENAINAGGVAMRRASKDGDDMARSLSNASVAGGSFGLAIRQVGTELTGLSHNGQAAFATLGIGLGATGLAVGALVALSVAKYAQYDAAISKSIAVTGAYGQELESIRKLTQELGATTVFTATEAAQGVTELGKAGVSTANILGGALAGSLNLAAAGEMAVADAAAITATTLNQFSLEGKDATHVSDLLAASAGKAQGEVSDMGLALRQSGLVAAQMGVEVEEAVGSLAAFASAGLLGSDAGTSFRTMLLALATPTAQQTALLKQYNIAAYDQRGNFVGIASLAGQLQKGFAGATQAQRDQALGIIFGSDAIRAANVLYKQGEQGIRDWTAAVDDSGYAARVAGINQDNLRGDIEKLGGAIDTALIRTGEGADGVLRDLTQTVTELVNGFSELPPELQEVILLGAALTAGTLLLGGAFLIGVPKVVQFRAAIALLRAEMPLTQAAMGRMTSFIMGPWGVALAAGGLAVHLLTNYVDSLKASTEDWQNAITTGASADDLFRLADQGRLVSFLGDATATAKDFRENLDLVARNDVFTGLSLEAQQLRQSLKDIGRELATTAESDAPRAAAAFRSIAEAYELTHAEQLELLDAMPEYRDALIEQATAQGISLAGLNENEKSARLLRIATDQNAKSTETAADAYLDANEQAEGLRQTLDDLLTLLNESNETGQDAITTNLAYKDALADVDAAIQAAREGQEGYALTLDTSTKAGRNNMDMLVDLAGNAWDAAEAQLALDGNTEAFQASLQASRDELIQRAQDLGYSAEQASALADQILRIPTEAEVKMIVDTQSATDQLKRWVTNVNGIRLEVVPVVGGRPINAGLYAHGGIVNVMAGGGVMGVESNRGAMPQFRKAGSWTVWAEDETGGETYIPHAMDRRARAEALLAQTAAIFGGAYIPSNANRRASGSVEATSRGRDSGGAMRITGTLDLGNGLTGLVDGMISTALDGENDRSTRGYRGE